MTRLMVLLPMMMACSVGEFGESTNPPGDGSGSQGGGDDKNLCVNKGTAAAAYNHTTAPTGPRSGMGCVAALCHLAGNLGSGASAFALAGSVFKDLNGTTPQPGVTVRLFPGSGAMANKSVAKVVTDSTGNFIFRDATLTNFPYATDVTACGTDNVAMGIRPMVGPIANADKNCNAGGTCHVVPKTATPIYLLD